MSELRRLNESGRNLVGPSFLEADSGKLRVAERHLESLDRTIDLSEFNEVVADHMDRYEAYDADIDGPMAVEVHRALPVTRRHAGDKGIWTYLTCIERPDFLRFRWGEGGSVDSSRVQEMRRNAFARLWWSAELTRRNGDYSLTEELWSKTGAQDLFEALIGRNFSHHRPGISAFIREVGNEDREHIRAVAKKLSQALMTVVLETMEEEDIRNMLQYFSKRIREVNYAE
ncbi:DUF6339 family protein [Salinibacter ruber]|uniref:DUF6339 family protein n=1 Tax=Salinibacter ruber TaxID=146919 RepID=UPI0013C36EE2|nr:DUF6339 family protein [Salinibacter ruber]